MRNTDKQRGAALILVLLVVAVIVSVGAFFISKSSQFL